MVEPQGLVHGALHVSFQRFARPAGGWITDVPRSLGTLPVPACGENFLLPIGDGEVFWIGLSLSPGAAPAAVRIVAERHDGVLLRSGDFFTPPSRWFAGFPDRHGLAVLDATLAWLTICHEATARIELAGWKTFADRTGTAAPKALDPSAAYGSWRLP